VVVVVFATATVGTVGRRFNFLHVAGHGTRQTAVRIHVVGVAVALTDTGPERTKVVDVHTTLGTIEISGSARRGPLEKMRIRVGVVQNLVGVCGGVEVVEQTVAGGHEEVDGFAGERSRLDALLLAALHRLAGRLLPRPSEQQLAGRLREAGGQLRVLSVGDGGEQHNQTDGERGRVHFAYQQTVSCR